MTSENSFLVNIKNNNKRRVWVWVLSILSMAAVFPGITTVYFARIDSYLANGYYQNTAVYRQALGQALIDGILSYPLYVSAVLAVIIAIQGYSYLFSKRKVDMYYAVPVSMKRRFFTIYFNGIAILAVPMLLGAAVTVGMSLIKGAQLDCLYGRFFAMVLIILLFSIGIYDLSVLAVMLTGNLFMAVSMSALLIFYVDIIGLLIEDYAADYWSTYLTVFDEESKGISPMGIAGYASEIIGNASYDSAFFVKTMLFAALKLLIWIVAAFIPAYINYRKRPAEAAGRSVVFYSNQLFIKLAAVVPGALFFGAWMNVISEGNKALVIITLILSTVFIGMLLEIAFNMEFKSAFRHWGSIVTCLILTGFIFAIFRYDIFGYDRYVPETDEIESYAVLNSNSYYTDVLDIDDNGQALDTYVDSTQYAKEHMKLTDTDAIVSLAQKGISTGEDNMENPLALSVYYRLKSGRDVSRTVWIDLSDESNDDLLNRIIGPAYYKEGIWQAMTMDVPDNLNVMNIYYSNSMSDWLLNITDADRIIELWREDMSKYDYDRVRYDDEQGYITITMSNWLTWTLPVYACFDNINGFLADEYDFKDEKLPLEAIESIEITGYDDYGDNVYDVTIDDPQSLSEVYDALYLRPIHDEWKPDDETVDNYGVQINLTQDYINIYNSVSLYSYSIKNDQADRLVQEGILSR